MKSVTSVLFLLSIVLFISAFWNALALKRPGFYPPKQVLKKRAASLAGAGVIFLLVTIILSRF
ncbi:hypothetical protein P9D43_18890 [Neobacillus niacini]|uniref:hypothetical protein n=1 Tax=Neobacillus niacini TaxID=86668 RepID=UPI0007AB27DC|nr:hypothetical protein [Neobacillus niacini]MEC1524070.1 hypothetical protein [Neobacillus niacini]